MSAARSARGGRWSATPATSRTRSPPTDSPMRCATPRCCRMPCSRCTPAPSPEVALAEYQDTRDRLSRSLVEVTESVCRYDWDGGRIRALLRRVSSAMSDEMDYLSARPHSGRTGYEARPAGGNATDTALPALVASGAARDGAAGNLKGAAMSVQVRLLGGFGVVRRRRARGGGRLGTPAGRAARAAARPHPRPPDAPRAGDRRTVARAVVGRRGARGCTRRLTMPGARSRARGRGAAP